ncbi:MAG: glycosyltransferase family 87 protein [Pseudomonadota bacterium]|nr:glycosyltransferase family 87 protein [Pseudomonadota bacterium]
MPTAPERPDPAVPRPSAWRRVAGVLALVLALAFLATSARELSRLPRLNAAVAVDLLPLWLGGHALAAGEDPNDEAVLERIFAEQGLHFRTGGFRSYYPPTAALLARPFAGIAYPDASWGFRFVCVGALVGAAVLVVNAAPSRGRVYAAVATLALVGVHLTVRPTRAVLPSGQVGPLIVLSTALALWGLARGRDRIGGVALALGAGIKLFPLVLLPAALGRRRYLGTVAIVGALLALGVAVSAPSLDLVAWARRFAGFVNQGVNPIWQRTEPMWMLRVWQARFFALGVPSVLAIAWTWRRRADPAVATALGALLVAWGGTMMAGSHHYHEALVLLPALGWVLVWPAQRGPAALSWGVALATMALVELVGARSSFSAPNSLHWVLVGYGTWIGCAIRLRWQMTQPTWLVSQAVSPTAVSPTAVAPKAVP